MKPREMKRWILQITSGTGPVEVRRFVGRIGPWLADELTRRGQRVRADVAWGDPDAPRAMQIRFDGDAAGLDDLLGTHELLARTAARGRRSRKRWFVGVELFVEGGHGHCTVSEEDIRFSTCRAGGPGGQHVNRSESAVQAVHVPSGVRVRVESERSQHRNRAHAVALIRRALAHRARCVQARAVAERRRAHFRVQRGEPVRSFRLDRRGRLVEVRDA